MEVKPTVRAEHPPVSQTSCTPGNANDALCLVFVFVFLDELTFGDSLKWPLIILQLLAQWSLRFADNPTIFTDVRASINMYI